MDSNTEIIENDKEKESKNQDIRKISLNDIQEKPDNDNIQKSYIIPLTDEEIQKKKHDLYGTSFEKSDFSSHYNFPVPN